MLERSLPDDCNKKYLARTGVIDSRLALPPGETMKLIRSVSVLIHFQQAIPVRVIFRSANSSQFFSVVFAMLIFSVVLFAQTDAEPCGGRNRRNNTSTNSTSRAARQRVSFFDHSGRYRTISTEFATARFEELRNSR